MKNIVSGALAGLAIAAVCASLALAQTNALRSAAGDKYLISAKAGGVNYVEGGVTLRDAAGRMTRMIKGNYVDVGERLETTSDGRAEILLNPGSYLRLGPNSAFAFETTNLDDLRLSVSRGGAVFEVFADEEFRVTVNTPASSFALIRSGVYRVDVNSENSATLSVWKGLATAGLAAQQIKAGREVTVSGGNFVAAKFDRDEKDPLDAWSRTRAKEAANTVSQLERRSMRTALMQSFVGRRWNVYDSFGLWVYSPFAGRYCFLPFGYGWSSPYGFDYGTWLGWYQLPPVIYLPPPGVPPPTVKTGRIYTPPTDSGSAVPPFVKIGGDRRGGNTPAQVDTETKSGRIFEPAPVYVPPIAPPVEVKVGRGKP